MENRFSYQDESLVKIREDNKIEFIVKREGSDFTPQQIEIFSKYNIEIYEELFSINSSIIYIPLSFIGQSIYSFLDELIEIPGISYIEPNFYDQLTFVPNDYFYATYQYDMPLIGMETAWNYQLGSSSVRVAVLDTGIDYNHPDLSANYIPLGYDWVNSDSDPMDDNNHGSHCAGTIAAVINNAIGVAGMSQVSIFAEKVLDASGSGSHGNFKSGMIHAVDQGADIISYSGGGSDSTTKKEGVDYAINHGVMVIAAAGNDNTNTPFYPAAYPEVIAVSATDQSDLKASFSNYGTWIDVAAPGVDIASTGTDGSYWLMSGTSMACPHVSGLAALIKSEYPSYTSSQLENTIINNAVDLGTPGFDVYFGWGRISALNVFEAPNEPTNPSPVDGATGVSSSPTLSVDVTDPYGDSMSVSFYDASDDSLIGTDTGVTSGGTATVTWSSLSIGTVYSWYAVANDGSASTTSSTWSFTTTYAPNAPINPSPADGATGIITSPTLSVDVSDPEGDSMDVSFYDASDDSLIGTDTGVASGGTASVSWLGLSEGTIYSWYAVANDGSASTTSPTWSFTTNYNPDAPTNPNPADHVYGVDLNPTLNVDVSDPEGDSMDVSFYDASDDSLIGTDTGVASGGTASVSWFGLSESTIYEWYAVANDGLVSTTSSTWVFTTNSPPDAPINPIPTDGATGINTNPILSVDVTDFDGNFLDVSFYDASDDSLIGTDTGVVSGGIASVSWLGLSEGTIYSWYAVANDGLTSTTSSTWSFTTNYAPNTITNPSPANGATGIITSPTLSVDVSDPDGDSMDVSFYDASDDSLIDTHMGVASGGTASVSWLGLSEGTIYSWYAVANDGLTSTTSSIWSFTSNNAPDTIINPSPADGATGVSTNPTLSVDVSDPDGDSMDVSFYDASDDSLIGTHMGVASGGTASVAWLGLSEGTIYSWYAVANDGLTSTTSSIWSFTSFLDIPIWDQTPIDQILEFGEALLCDLNASDLSGIALYWINDTSNFNIDSNGVITNNGALAVGEYTVEIRAFDPFDNYCTAIITITVEDTTNPTWDLTPTDQILEFGEALLCDLNASDLSGIALYWINDTSNFNIDSNGVITNNGALAVGEYTVEIRAFDPFDNYCTAIITITVKVPEEVTDTPLPAVPGYNIIFLICTISIISLVVTRKQIKKKH